MMSSFGTFHPPYGMRRHFENTHNELDYACVGNYKPQFGIRDLHTHQSILAPCIHVVRTYVLTSSQCRVYEAISTDGIAPSYTPYICRKHQNGAFVEM